MSKTNNKKTSKTSSQISPKSNLDDSGQELEVGDKNIIEFNDELAVGSLIDNFLHKKSQELISDNHGHNKLGKFICLEGIEGVGKTTQINWMADYLKASGKEVVITHEPGGTLIGEKIRTQLLKSEDFLANKSDKITDDVEMLLMFAARSQHVTNKILPALERGAWVVCSRFFESSFAYQGGGRGIDTHRIESLKTWVLGDFRPDLTLLFDITVDKSRKRVGLRGEKKDRIESQDDHFFERVRQMYLRRSQLDESIKVVDAGVDIKQVQDQIRPHLDLILK